MSKVSHGRVARARLLSSLAKPWSWNDSRCGGPFCLAGWYAEATLDMISAGLLRRAEMNASTPSGLRSVSNEMRVTWTLESCSAGQYQTI